MNSPDVKKANLAHSSEATFQPTKKKNPAAEAGLSRAVYFKEDTWIVGDKKYCAPRYKIPKELAGLYQPSGVLEKTDKELDETNSYDRSKFEVESLWSIEEPRTTTSIIALPSGRNLAVLYLDTEQGFTIHFTPPKEGLFAFTEHEFCDALSVARWTLALDISSDEKGQAMYGRPTERNSIVDDAVNPSDKVDGTNSWSPSASPARKP